VRTVLERGPKGKRFVAYAIDWPGWSRGAKTPEAALELLEDYRARYRPIAARARLAKELDGSGPLEVIEDRVGTPSTDFWGISFAPCSLEQDPMDRDELTRKLRLVKACWAHFDDVAASVSEEMRKGPRGGGWDRTRIWRHTIRVESEDFAKKVGVGVPDEGALTPESLLAHREDYVDAIRRYQAGKLPPMRSGSLAHLVRHTGFHVMDHTWEMEDKDLTAER
jgi:hypothetical protein